MIRQVLCGAAAMLVMLSAGTARADWAVFKGETDEELNRVINKSPMPVVVVYTAPWIKGADRDFEANLRKYVEPHYKGKVRFLVVDVDKNLSAPREWLKQPYADVFKITKDSVDGKTKSATWRGRVEAGTDPLKIRDVIDEVVVPEMDVSNEPFVQALREKQRLLAMDMKTISDELEADKCRQMYATALKKAFSLWLDEQGGLLSQRREAQATRERVRREADEWYESSPRELKKVISWARFKELLKSGVDQQTVSRMMHEGVWSYGVGLDTRYQAIVGAERLLSDIERRWQAHKAVMESESARENLIFDTVYTYFPEFDRVSDLPNFTDCYNQIKWKRYEAQLGMVAEGAGARDVGTGKPAVAGAPAGGRTTAE
ncbi:MAG: hypothetical protein HY075_12905 [Deltaproteobacteria bacterium]|nr:hypothetical protein [Deltaproteobacteria bacterium]